MKKHKRIVAMLVFIAIAIGYIPFTTFANDKITQLTTTDDSDASIVEVVELREESIKHFRLPDGSYEAVSYAGPVHRKDSNGVWQDIDNNLSTKKMGSKQQYTTNDSRFNFAKNYSVGSELVSVNEGKYVISMSMLQQQKENISTEKSSTAVFNSASKRAQTFKTIEEAMDIENKTSIVYSNVAVNTDIALPRNISLRASSRTATSGRL